MQTTLAHLAHSPIYAKMGAPLLGGDALWPWLCIVVYTVILCLPVAMGVGSFVGSIASGLMLLIMGFLLDATSLSTTTRWNVFFILVTCLAGISVLLTGISLYYDTAKNPLHPLRARHTVPVLNKTVTAGPLTADELIPLLGDGKCSINPTSASAVLM